jgi:hypothetical protein
MKACRHMSHERQAWNSGPSCRVKCSLVLRGDSPYNPAGATWSSSAHKPHSGWSPVASTLVPPVLTLLPHFQEDKALWSESFAATTYGIPLSGACVLEPSRCIMSPLRSCFLGGKSGFRCCVPGNASVCADRRGRRPSIWVPISHG